MPTEFFSDEYDPSKWEYSGYDTKLNLVEKLSFLSFGKQEVPLSLSSLSLVWSFMVLPVYVLSIGQKDLFENYY